MLQSLPAVAVGPCPATNRCGHTSAGFSRADSNPLASCSGRQVSAAWSGARPLLRTGSIAGALPVSIRQIAHLAALDFVSEPADGCLQVKDATQSYLSEQDLFGEEQLDTTLQVPSRFKGFSEQHVVGIDESGA